MHTVQVEEQETPTNFLERGVFNFKQALPFSEKISEKPEEKPKPKKNGRFAIS